MTTDSGLPPATPVQLPPVITDVCLVTHDIETAIAFYTEKMGFELESIALPHFADFRGHGVLLALWSSQALREFTPVPAATQPTNGPTTMLAVKLPEPSAIDRMYEALTARGMEFYGPPDNYPWNVRAVYAPGASGEFWEFFAWLEDGKSYLVDTE